MQKILDNHGIIQVYVTTVQPFNIDNNNGDDT